MATHEEEVEPDKSILVFAEPGGVVCHCTDAQRLLHAWKFDGLDYDHCYCYKHNWQWYALHIPKKAEDVQACERLR